MPSRTFLHGSSFTNTALHLSRKVWETIRSVSHHCEDFEIIQSCSWAFWIDCVQDCATQSLHQCLTLVPTELPNHLQLLWHVFMCEVQRHKVKLKLLINFTHLNEWIWTKMFLRPLMDKGLEAEVRAHNSVSSTHCQSHEFH